MPLAGKVTEKWAAEWVTAKDSQWESNGYGPWAVLVNGEFRRLGRLSARRERGGLRAGAVFQVPGDMAPTNAGGVDRGFGDMGLDEVIIALPYSRSPDRVVTRFGFVPDGEVTYGGVPFRQYRLTRQARPRLTRLGRMAAKQPVVTRADHRFVFDSLRVP